MLHRISLVAFSVVFTTAAFAQEEQTEEVRMQVDLPGAPDLSVKVKTRTTTRTTTTRVVESPEYPGPAPAPALDCGTGPDDPGCSMRRKGHEPMDGESFRGLLEALRSNDNEINRNDIAQETLKTEFLTARQLSKVLDLFQNEIYRFDVAKLAAPHLVNPKHAMSLSSKFQNSIYATDFTKLMVSQR